MTPLDQPPLARQGAPSGDRQLEEATPGAGDDETGGDHGRIGYGRVGRYTPLALALLLVISLAAIGLSQRREASPKPASQLAGQPAPEVTLTLLDGSALRLADLRGSVVVLNFWASWCQPCREEMPLLQRVSDEAARAGEATVIVGVGIRTDTDADARGFVKQLGLTYPIGRDTATDAPGVGPIERAFGLTNLYPSTVIVRPDGVVDRLILGPVTESQLRFAIDEARAAAASSTTHHA
jgi:thiol-disulfide isomerase/thioredoxin